MMPLRPLPSPRGQETKFLCGGSFPFRGSSPNGNADSPGLSRQGEALLAVRCLTGGSLHYTPA